MLVHKYLYRHDATDSKPIDSLIMIQGFHSMFNTYQYHFSLEKVL